ncbi:hypothetical protein TELCIR_00032 [Teladorsagia circumcincta]|uniref:URB1 C-terminal domain-containing protein n=1 Tax=Teladorsagia circumcincta TaxID=45464 RepID=A0A2G9V782_TELCI|nr:hypothetical protein TELCIR_00032 [Teladorsagia circumcincta]
MTSYNATTSEEDCKIYEALELLENTYKVNMNIISPIIWGEQSVEIYKKRGQFGGTLNRTTPEQVLELLDGLRMWKTVMNHSRPVMADVDGEIDDRKILYDVRFLLRLFLSMMHPGSELKYRPFVEQNGLALAFSCTSSKEVTIRKLAYCVLQKFLSLLHVPEIYKMLLSSSTDYHKQEREWMLTLILEGLIEPMDYNVLQNRSGIKLLLALFPTCMIDMVSRRLILSILKAAVQMPSVAHDLFYRMNLHTWIASIIKNRDLSVWEQCYLGQIYSILIENERKNCRSAKGDASHLVALASVRITARVSIFPVSCGSAGGKKNLPVLSDLTGQRLRFDVVERAVWQNTEASGIDPPRAIVRPLLYDEGVDADESS